MNINSMLLHECLFRFLKWFSRKAIGSQLVCAADSVGANIAEGTGGGTYNDNRRFFYIARGSLTGTKHWLRRTYHRGVLTTAEIGELKSILGQLAPMLNTYLNAITQLARKAVPAQPICITTNYYLLPAIS